MCTKESITEMLKNYCYNNFGEEIKVIKPDTSVSYNDEGVYDYGITIKNYKKEEFGYEFDNFITYVMLYEEKENYPEIGYALYFWRYTYDYSFVKENPTKKDVNKALSNFIIDAANYLLKDKPNLMITFGDGNMTFVLLQYYDYYTLIKGSGS